MVTLIKRRNVAEVAAKPMDAVRVAKYAELRAALTLNKDTLDIAAERQADLFLEVCEHHAISISRRDEARDILSRTDARLAQDIRAKAAKEQTKITNDQVTDQIMLHPEHQAAASEYARLKREADDWGNLRDAYDQRMRMIRELVAMYTTGYWTNSSAGRANSDVRGALANDARERMEQARETRRAKGGM